MISDPFAGRAAPNLDLNDNEVTPVVPAEPSEALVLANVGDSRTYLFRHGRLRRVTVDHSYVQELVSTGHITEDEARDHPRRNIITRALGIEPEVRVDWWTLPLIRGDRFVLCSDGLVDEVADVDIASTLTIETDPQVAADRLVEKANEAGGRDNITVVVVDVLEGDDPPDPTQELDVVPVWAEAGTDPTPAGTLELDPDAASSDDEGLAADADAPDGPSTPRRRSTPVRLAIGFVAAAAVVVAFVVFSAWARSGWFVAFDDQDQAVIYQGRPGGVLWIEPTADAVGPRTRRVRPGGRQRHRGRAAIRQLRGRRRVHQRRHDDHDHHDDDHDDDHDGAAVDDRRRGHLVGRRGAGRRDHHQRAVTETAAPTWYVEDDGVVERPDSPLARSRRTTELRS